jgi:hypothetical protein
MAQPNLSLPSISVQFAFTDLQTGVTPTAFSRQTVRVTNVGQLVSFLSGFGAMLVLDSFGSITPKTTGGQVTLLKGSTLYTIAYDSALVVSGQYVLSNVVIISGTPGSPAYFTTDGTETILLWNWYEAGSYVRDISTRMGRQHELDRTESSSAQFILESRDGRWLPWSASAFSYTSVTTGATDSLVSSTILKVGVPVKITATWNGTTYPVFFGFVDQWEPSALDELDVDTTVTCTDLLKKLSVTRLSNSSLYWKTALAPITNSNVTPDVLRLNDQPSLVTGKVSLRNSGVGGFITSGVAGSGLTLSATSNVTINFTRYSIATSLPLQPANGTFQLWGNGQQLTVSYTTATSSGTAWTFTGCRLTQPGQTYVTNLGDYIVGGVATGSVGIGMTTANAPATTALVASSFNQNGPLLYDPTSQGIDLTNTGGVGHPALGITISNGAAYYLSLAAITNARYGYTGEAWFKGTQPGDSLIQIVDATRSGTTIYSYVLQVSTASQLTVSIRTTTSGGTTTTLLGTYSWGQQVTDGNWHLVTFFIQAEPYSSNTFNFNAFVDGVLCGYFQNNIATLAPTSVNFGTYTSGIYPTTGSGPYQVANCNATISEVSFGVDDSTYAPGSLNRARVGSYFRSNGVAAYISSTTTISSTSSATLPLVNSNGFFPSGGLAIMVSSGAVGITFKPYVISYSGVTAGVSPALTGVQLYPPETTTTTTVSANYGEMVLHAQGTTTGYRLKEIAEVVGLVPADGSSTLTTTPLNYSPGVISQLALEQGAVYSTTALDYGFQYEKTENGFFYQASSGVLTFLPRFYPQTHAQNSTQFTDSGTSTSQAHYLPAIEMVLDDLDTWTIAQTTSTIGQTSTFVDPTGTYLAKYGARTYSRGQMWANRQTDIDALGSMIVNRYKQPIVRPRKVIIESTYSDGTTQPNQAVQLGANLWDQVVFNRTAYGASYAQTVVIESISHEYQAEPGRWRTTFVLSPYEMNGSSTVNAGSFFRLSTSTGAADYSKFQTAKGSVSFGTTLSSSGSSLQLNPGFASINRPLSLRQFPTSGNISIATNTSGTVPASYSGQAQPLTTTVTAATLTTSSSVTLTLASVTNFPAGGGQFWYVTSGSNLVAGPTYWPCSYTSVSGLTILGCKLVNTSVGSSLTTTSTGNYVVGPATLTGVVTSGGYSGTGVVSVGDTVTYDTGTGQDAFGG